MVSSPPPFLEQAFNVGDLEAEEATLVALDADDTIAWVNPAWGRFARENGAPEVAERFGVGQPYLGGVSGPLRGFYADLFGLIRAERAPWEQLYECSSPSEFRQLHLRILPLDADGLLLEHSICIRRPQQHTPHPGHDAAYRDRHGILLQCSNCRRVRHEGGGWHWVEPWVRRPPPATSHGLCGPCEGFYVLAQEHRRRPENKTR